MGNEIEKNERQPQGEIPLPIDRVILLDKDLTLVDASYHITDQRIYDVIRNLQDDGWRIGISSDTGLETLRQFRDQFGLNGPIIAERGGIVETEDEVLFDKEDSPILLAQRDAMVKALREDGIKVIDGGLMPPKKGEIIGSPGDIVAIVNMIRRCSIGFNFRRILADGSHTFDEETTTQLVEKLRPLYPDFPDLVEDVNHQYGVLIVSRAIVNKRNATQRLMEREGLKQIAMVGNSITDYIGSDIALHYAVSNATDEFKERADYISEDSMTTGVVEILTKIQETSKRQEKSS